MSLTASAHREVVQPHLLWTEPVPLQHNHQNSQHFDDAVQTQDISQCLTVRFLYQVIFFSQSTANVQ